MKTVFLLLLIVLALGGGYWFGMQRGLDGSIPGGAEEDSHGDDVSVKTGQQYTCGMHPFIIRDEPGLCPICSMELTPVKPGTSNPSQDGGDETISIDPTTVQNMGVRTEKVSRRRLEKTLRTVGLMTYEEGRQYSINSKIDGWVEKLHVNEEGRTIARGRPLLEIYSPELVAAQQEYLLALRNARKLAAAPLAEVAESGGRLLEAARNRLKYWDISEQQIAALEASGMVSKTLTLFSPQSGVVTSKKVVEGMRVAAGEELLRISDISRIWINADIFEYELPWLKVGQAARIELPFAPGKVYSGKITYIYPYLKNETRTARARVELANPGLELKPDMYANVQIETQTIVDALVIPSHALLNSGNGQTVFVALDGGKFEPRQVTSGVSDDGGYVQILSGLAEGEPVVVSAQFLLDSESSLRTALRKMSAPPAPLAAPPAEELDDLFK
jgi:Cu(I)/Ag(I) efflux system membrane fusion protein/cobalt-zinc-cadmium efflux system membrane fusion protein